MSQKTSLGDRMKRYEITSQSLLLRRSPVIIRLDGKAFHTYTRSLKVFDEQFHQSMMYTMEMLLKNVQNCTFAYTQSDEISLLLRDWNTLETQQWFDGNVQKLVSVSASIATAAFNADRLALGKIKNFKDFGLFDSRAFNIPKEDVANYFIWRQKDAISNSIQMTGRSYFSAAQLHKQDTEAIKAMLIANSTPWEQLDRWKKYGSSGYTLASEPGRTIINDNIDRFTFNSAWVD